LLPVLTKANRIRGAVFTEHDLLDLRQTDSKCYLLRIPPDADVSTDSDLKSYIERGRSQSIHSSFQKCRDRWPWYSVPYSQAPDLFLTSMSGKRSRLCVNEAGVNCTNTIHQVSLGDRRLTKACAASFYSSLTGASMELAGRSYGGGLMKLEPSDAKSLLLPNLALLGKSGIARLEALLPRIDAELRMERAQTVWEELDRLILVESLGLTIDQCNMLQEECVRLQSRRMNRSRGIRAVADIG